MRAKPYSNTKSYLVLDHFFLFISSNKTQRLDTTNNVNIVTNQELLNGLNVYLLKTTVCLN